MAPFSAKDKIVNRAGQDVAEGGRYFRARSGGLAQSNSPLVNTAGQYNASSKKDLADMLLTLSEGLRGGDLKKKAELTVDAGTADFIREAARDPQLRGGAFERLGEVFTDVIYETMGRQAFTDKILARTDASEGSVPRVRVGQHDVQAWHMTSNGPTRVSTPTPRFIYPEGYWLNGFVLIDEEDLFYAGESYLEEKHNDALVAIMVREDNATRDLMDNASTIRNSLVNFGAFTPTVFSSLRQQIRNWGLTPSVAIIAVDLEADMLSNAAWDANISPVEQHERFVEGYFGQAYGVELFTDGYRYDSLQVLEAGEVYMLSAPATLGAKIVMRPLQSVPVDRSPFGEARRGWFLKQYQAETFANARGISKGVKL